MYVKRIKKNADEVSKKTERVTRRRKLYKDENLYLKKKLIQLIVKCVQLLCESLFSSLTFF